MRSDGGFLEVGEEFLEHFGKRGMKWGVRNTKNSYRTPKPAKPGPIPKNLNSSDKEINAARARQHERYTISRVKLRQIKSDKTTVKGRITLNNQLIQMQKVHVKNPDYHTAKLMTKGESYIATALAIGFGAGTGLLGYPIGVAAAGGGAIGAVEGLHARLARGGKVKFVQVK